MASLALNFLSDEAGYGQRFADPPLLNRTFGPLSQALSCNPCFRRFEYSNGAHCETGRCEPFFRLDRPRTYLLLGALGLASYGIYRMVK